MIGGGHVMLADAAPEMGARAAGAFGGSPVSLCIHVDDVDQVVERAVAREADPFLIEASGVRATGGANLHCWN